jgi:hypothetical protein
MNYVPWSQRKPYQWCEEGDYVEVSLEDENTGEELWMVRGTVEYAMFDGKVFGVRVFNDKIIHFSVRKAAQLGQNVIIGVLRYAGKPEPEKIGTQINQYGVLWTKYSNDERTARWISENGTYGNWSDVREGEIVNG